MPRHALTLSLTGQIGEMFRQVIEPHRVHRGRLAIRASDLHAPQNNLKSTPPSTSEIFCLR